MRVDRCGPRSLQAAEVHTSHLKAATLHRMTAKGELRLCGLSDDGIFFLLFRGAFKERWIQMTANRWGEKQTQDPPGRKEKSKKEKLLNSNSGEEDKKTKRLKNKPNKNKPYLSLMAG
jgi:hypothetical protein